MTILISYSHDSEEHKQWVSKLASKLKLSGIRVILDQTHLNAGDYLTAFMEEYIEKVDYVLIVCTDNYNQRAKERKGGVGYEINLISAEILDNPRTNKFIPIVRNVTSSKKTPACLNGKLYCDFSENQEFSEQFDALLKKIKGEINEYQPISSKNEGWSANINNEKVIFKQGEPVSVKYEDGKIEQFQVINDDIMCLEQIFPNGAIAYIEVNKEGDIVSHKFPYPISDYSFVIDKNLIINTISHKDEQGFIHHEAVLKWGRSCTWSFSPDGKLYAYHIEKGCNIDHINKCISIN
jgi:hypothetical protein